MSRRLLRRAGRWILAIAVVLALGTTATLGACRWQAYARESKPRAEAAPRAGRFVRAADVDLFLQEAGPENGPVVVFIHGMGAWSELWRSTIEATAAAGFRAVALDLPPFGYSERPPQKTYGRISQARRILGVLDALAVAQATLVGHSFGGGPTMEAVLLAPDRVSALVLADAAIGPDTPAGAPGLAGRMLRFRPLRNAIVSATVTNPRFTRNLLGRFVAAPGAVTDGRVAVLQAPLAVQGTTDAFGDWLFEFLTSQEEMLSRQPRAYARLTVPTLVIWGDRDDTTPLADGQRLAELIPGTELAIMNGVGHMPQIENVDDFNRLLLTFLQRQQLARSRR